MSEVPNTIVCWSNTELLHLDFHSYVERFVLQNITFRPIVNVWKKIHVGAICSGRTKYIKPKINRQKGICVIGILQLDQVFWSASFSKLWIMSDDWKLAIPESNIGCYSGSFRFISFSIIYLHPFVMLSLTPLDISDCKVIEYNKFPLNSKVIAYFSAYYFAIE